MADGQTLGEAVVATAAVVRENIRLRRAFVMSAGGGEAVGCYLHGLIAPGLGRQAALVKAGTAGTLLPYRDASACMRRHHASALAPWDTATI